MTPRHSSRKDAAAHPESHLRRLLRACRSRRVLLLVVVAGLLAAVVPLAAAPSAHADDPCSALKGPARQFCESDPEDDGDTAPKPNANCAKSIDDNPFLSFFAPTEVRPERPREGWGGDFTSPPKRPPGPHNTAHLYEYYGLGGMTWAPYDPDCKAGITGYIDTTVGNFLFGGSRYWTGLALAVQQEAGGSDSAVNRLDPVVATATHKVRDAVFNPWIGASVALLGAVLIWQSRTRGMHQLLQAAAWALLVMTAATAAASYPAHAGRLADTAITSTVGQVQQSIAGGGSGKGTSPATTQGNLLTGQLMYRQWLRGAFGSADSHVAKKFGPSLYDAQALTWDEDRQSQEKRRETIKAKAKSWKHTAKNIREEDHDAYRHLTGQITGFPRISAAFTASLAVTPAVIFTLAVAAVVLCALLVIRLTVVFAPAIAPFGIHKSTSPAIRTLGKTVAAALIHAPLFAVAGAVDVLLMRALLSPSAHLPTWFAIVLIWVLTAMLWRMARPLRSMGSLIRPDHPYMGSGIEAVSKPVGAAARVPQRVGRAYLTHYLSARALARQLDPHRGRKKTRRTTETTTRRVGGGDDPEWESQVPEAESGDDASTPVDAEPPALRDAASTDRVALPPGLSGATGSAGSGSSPRPTGSTASGGSTPTAETTQGTGGPWIVAPSSGGGSTADHIIHPPPGDRSYVVAPGRSDGGTQHTVFRPPPNPADSATAPTRDTHESPNSTAPGATSTTTTSDGPASGRRRTRTGPPPTTGTSGRSRTAGSGSTPAPDVPTTPRATGPGESTEPPRGTSSPPGPQSGDPPVAAEHRDAEGSTVYTIYTPSGGFRRTAHPGRDTDPPTGRGRYSTPEDDGGPT